MGTRQGVARLAIAAGVAAIAADVAFFTFMAVGQPFGSVNDVANGTFAILAGWLAWQLRERTGLAVAVLALAGAAVAVVGSWLVLSGTTSWFLAGLVSAIGLALIGPSLIATGRSLAAAGSWPAGLGRLAVVTGSVMVTGLATIPGVVQRFDDATTAPGWIWIGFTGWVGAYVLYPAWAIWLGRTALRAEPPVADAYESRRSHA